MGNAGPRYGWDLCDSWDLWVGEAVARRRFPIASGLRTPTMLNPRTRHPLPDPAIVDKIALQAANLLVKQIVRLVDETDGDICDDLGGATVAELAEIAVTWLRLRREPPNEEGFSTLVLPEPMVS
jgi:hypothetical protein